MKHDSPYHGGYGLCNGFGSVWVDEGENSNSYRGGPPCPVCIGMTEKLHQAQQHRPVATVVLPLIVGVAYRIRRHHSEINQNAVDLIISAPKPARHPSLYHYAGNAQSLRLQGEFDDPLKEDGFILSDGTFVNREEAATLAKANGQLQTPLSGTRLFSEDLW